MENDKLISKTECCALYEIELTFLDNLHEYGLIEMSSVEGNYFIGEGQLQQLERCIRLYYDLDINLEGIDVISNLLHRVKSLQDEIQQLKTRLQLHRSMPE